MCDTRDHACPPFPSMRLSMCPSGPRSTANCTNQFATTAVSQKQQYEPTTPLRTAPNWQHIPFHVQSIVQRHPFPHPVAATVSMLLAGRGRQMSEWGCIQRYNTLPCTPRMSPVCDCVTSVAYAYYIDLQVGVAHPSAAFRAIVDSPLCSSAHLSVRTLSWRPTPSL